MKRLLPYLLALAVFTLTQSCSKVSPEALADLVNNSASNADKKKDTICDIVLQTGYRLAEPTEASYIGGFTKVYDKKGNLETVNVALLKGGNYVDSITYTFRNDKKNDNIIYVKSQTDSYHFNTGTGQLDFLGASSESAEIAIHFNAATGYVNDVSGIRFDYDGSGRLTGTTVNFESVPQQNLQLAYDANGNVASVLYQFSPGQYTKMKYEYDLAQAAPTGVHIPIGLIDDVNGSSWYGLFEITGWIPVQPNNLQTAFVAAAGYNAFGEEYVNKRFDISNNVIDSNNRLLSFDINDGTDTRTITNTWDCFIVKEKKD